MQLIPIAIDGQVAITAEGAGDVLTQVIEATVALYARRGFEPPWIGYLGLEAQRWVGACGFTGPPADGELEIAYFSFPGNEGRGVATSMARALLEACRPAAQAVGARFIAHTLPQHGPSTTILRKLGFNLVGEVLHPEDGRVWKWIEPEGPEGQVGGGAVSVQ